MSQDFATLALRVQQAGAAQTEKSLRSVAREANKLAREFKKVEDATKGSTDATKGAAAATDKAANANEKLDRGLTRSSGRLKVIGRDINRYLVLPLTALIGLSARAALTLNEGLGAVQTLIPTAGDRIYELRDGIKDLAQESGRSMKELNDGLYQTISVFQDNADTMDRVTTATKMAIAGYASTTDAVNLLSSVTRAYGDTSAAAVEKVADLAFETVRLGATTIPQLAGAMQVATDTAVRMNVSQEELFTVMATLTGITGDASMVATEFRSAMNSLLNPTETMTTLIGEMGFNSAEAAIEQLGLITFLKAIHDAAEASDVPLQNYIKRIEGMTLVSRLSTQQFDDYNKKLVDITNYHGAATRSFDIVRDGIAKYNFQLNVAKQRASVLAAEVGENMLPSLVSLATILVDVIEAFSQLPDVLQRSLVGFTALSLGVSIMYQLRGVIQSFIQYNVFTGFMAGITAVTGGATVLKAVLSALFPVLGILAATMAVVTVAIIRQNRAIAESAREAESRLESLEALSRRVGISTSGDDPSAVEGRAGLMRTGGFLPAAPGENITALTFKAMTDLSASDKERLKAEYKNQLEALLVDAGRIQSNLENRFRDEFIGRSDGTAQHISTYLNDEWITKMFGVTTSGGVARREAMLELVDATDIDLDAIITKMQEQVNELEEQYTVVGGVLAGDFVPRGTRAGAGELQKVEAARDQYKQLTQALIDINTVVENNAAWSAYADAINDADHEITNLMAAISLIDEAIAATPTSDSPAMMTWQEWFAEVTGIAEAAMVRTGGQAVDLFVSSFESRRREQGDIADLLGFSVDDEKVLRDRLGEIASTMEELFSKKDIDKPFTIIDPTSLAMAEEYRNVLSELSGTVLDNLTAGFEEADAEIKSTNEMIDEFGLNIDHAALSQDDFSDRVQTLTGALAELVALGLDPGSDAAKAFANAIKGMAVPSATHATTEVEKLIASLEEQNHTFHMSEREMFEYSLTLMDDVSPAQKAYTMELYDTKKELEEAAAEAAMFDGVLHTLITSFVDSGVRMFADTLFDIGQALGEDALNANNAADMFAQLGLQLLKLIPQLMITAGLQILIATMGTSPMGWALLAMGLAGTVGAGVVTGMYNDKKQRAIDRAADENAMGNVFSEGNIVPFASGGAFTNSIVNKPTLFPMAKGAGLMGEAGPEAIMPLARTSTGELGVKAESTGPPVVVNVINKTDNSQASVSESTGDNGMREIKVMIENVVRKGTASGAFDKVNRSRYGITPQGVRV